MTTVKETHVMQSFNKALLPEKVILSGADCFHLVLDKHAQKHGAGGNVMRKVFYFDTLLSSEEIHVLLKRSPVIYWLCNIRLDEGFLFQSPCWRVIDLRHEPQRELQSRELVFKTKSIDVVHYDNNCFILVA